MRRNIYSYVFVCPCPCLFICLNKFMFSLVSCFFILSFSYFFSLFFLFHYSFFSHERLPYCMSVCLSVFLSVSFYFSSFLLFPLHSLFLIDLPLPLPLSLSNLFINIVQFEAAVMMINEMRTGISTIMALLDANKQVLCNLPR